jgi:hypothetical protein
MECHRNWPTHSKCRISVSWKNLELFGWADWKCPHREQKDSDCYGIIQFFFKFVQDEEGLPIHFPHPGPPPPARNACSVIAVGCIIDELDR